MRIDRLRLKNFRCFEEKTFDFHPEFNLIVGVNGTGKTSILEALSIAQATWLAGLKNKFDQRNLRVNEATLKLETIAQEKRYIEQYPVEIEAQGQVMGQDLTWLRSKDSQSGRTRYGQASALITCAKTADSDVRAGKKVLLPLIAYYGTMRLWQEPKDFLKESRILRPEEVSKPHKLSPFEGYRFSVDPRISVANQVAWFARQAWITFQEGRETMALHVLKEAVLGCLEGAKNLFFDPSRGELMIQLGSWDPQPFVNLSDGQKVMLALVADIAQKAIWLNPHLGDQVLQQTEGLVLIDELDLHLHPRWQRHIIEDLRNTFPKIQFICTTHSPFLIQSLRSGEELLLLDGQTTTELGNKGIEEIAKGIMGVERPDAGLRYQRMKAIAKHYLEELELADQIPSAKLAAFKKRLAEEIAPYAENPAFQAFLEMKRVAKLGE